MNTVVVYDFMRILVYLVSVFEYLFWVNAIQFVLE